MTIVIFSKKTYNMIKIIFFISKIILIYKKNKMINKILIATDFSKNATHARNYGLNLANTLKADVVIFNAYEIPNSLMGTHTFRNYKDVFKKNSVNRLGEEIIESKGLFKNINISCEYVCDVSENAILERCKNSDIGLVVLGSKGGSKILKKLFGGTCTGIINKTKTPLIIVPLSSKIKIPKNIILATGFYINKTLFITLKELATRFFSKIDIITVLSNKENEKSILTKQLEINSILKSEIKSTLHVFHIINNDSIENGILEYIENNNVDLLTVIPKHKNFWENLIKTSISKKLVNSSIIPLLILPEKN